jgi:hypothetical protein
LHYTHILNTLAVAVEMEKKLMHAIQYIAYGGGSNALKVLSSTSFYYSILSHIIIFISVLT